MLVDVNTLNELCSGLSCLYQGHLRNLWHHQKYSWKTKITTAIKMIMQTIAAITGMMVRQKSRMSVVRPPLIWKSWLTGGIRSINIICQVAVCECYNNILLHTKNSYCLICCLRNKDSNGKFFWLLAWKHVLNIVEQGRSGSGCGSPVPTFYDQI